MQTPEITICLLKFLLKITTDFLIKYNISYFIDGGTLLGACRNKDIIPHDDDVDIGVLKKDWNKLLTLLNELKSYVIIINDEEFKTNIHIDDCLIKIYIPNFWLQIGDRIVSTPTLDIFCYELKNDKIRLSSKNHRKLFKNCYYNKNEMFPLTTYQIGDSYYYGCNNPKPYLFRYYGNDCLEVIKEEKRDIRNPQIKYYS